MKMSRTIWFVASLALGVARAQGPAAPVPHPGPATPPGPPEKAEERFKNIQALKGYPADEVFPAMQFISASVGQDCEFCHVEHAPEKDDKKEKVTARKMITMTFAINRENFDGKREVTCMSCHRGAARPVAVPPVATADEEPEAAPAAPAAPAELPKPDAVLDKYVTAVGGTAALAKIESRVEKGTLSGFGPQPFPIEIYSKAPGKRASIVETPRGRSVTAFDGTSGWLENSGRPPHDMSASEAAAARLDADLMFPTDVKTLFKEIRALPSEPIDGHPTVRLMVRNEGEPPVELTFDAASGLLLRLVRYAETPLGRNPTQIDYADYRETGGVTIPFRWMVARPGGRFTIQIAEALQNVPVDDAKFQKAPPPS
jgi:photosynthetic reaction center cytochrome c subunit